MHPGPGPHASGWAPDAAAQPGWKTPQFYPEMVKKGSCLLQINVDTENGGMNAFRPMGFGEWKEGAECHCGIKADHVIISAYQDISYMKVPGWQTIDLARAEYFILSMCTGQSTKSYFHHGYDKEENWRQYMLFLAVGEGYTIALCCTMWAQGQGNRKCAKT
eukprot:scaffold58343_cov15-Tisochrysis_lutea.AAC.1